jgi:hypothetical protein
LALKQLRNEQGDYGKERSGEAYFDIDLIVSLALASHEEFSARDIAEEVVALKKSVPFDMRDWKGRILATDEMIWVAVEELLAEGVHEGWIEPLTMTYPDRSRRGIPLRLRELLTDSPLLGETLSRILAHVGLPPV